MLMTSNLKRTSVVSVYLLAVIASLGASAVVLTSEHCRGETLYYLAKSVEVGLMLAMLKWLERLQKPVMLDQPVSAWIALLRLFTATETKYALAGGYLLALVKGCCHVVGW